ncbi:MAG: 3-carboxy-cis,cis-muconate cycloisomerase [Gammaproteobacteria bacterium]|jgi:3-carboxy-cis,cis-muconate cycloisomerase
MPHKRNPRSAEFAEGVARLGRHRAAGLGEVMRQEQERSGGTYVAEWVLVPEVFALTSAALEWSIDLFDRLEVDAAQMRENIDRTHGLVLCERFTLFLATRMNKFDARAILDDACARCRETQQQLHEVLAAIEAVRAVATQDELADLANPSTYLGAAGEMTDRAVALSRAKRK